MLLSANKLSKGVIFSQKKGSCSFPKFLKIQKKPDFRTLFSSPPIRTRSILLFYRKNDYSFPRLGLGIHQSCGSAVERNRIKRIVREFFRHAAKNIGPLDIHIVLKRAKRKHTLDKAKRKKEGSWHRQEILQDSAYALRQIHKKLGRKRELN